MARISGVTIPNEKQLHVALTYVYGIGPKHSADILAAANHRRRTHISAIGHDALGFL